MIAEGPLRLMVRGLADPTVEGTDRLDGLAPAIATTTPPAPVIFAPNHHSHLDTPLMFTAVPCRGAAS